MKLPEFSAAYDAPRSDRLATVLVIISALWRHRRAIPLCRFTAHSYVMEARQALRLIREGGAR